MIWVKFLPDRHRWLSNIGFQNRKFLSFNENVEHRFWTWSFNLNWIIFEKLLHDSFLCQINVEIMSRVFFKYFKALLDLHVNAEPTEVALNSICGWSSHEIFNFNQNAEFNQKIWKPEAIRNGKCVPCLINISLIKYSISRCPNSLLIFRLLDFQISNLHLCGGVRSTSFSVIRQLLLLSRSSSQFAFVMNEWICDRTMSGLFNEPLFLDGSRSITLG